MQFSVRHFFAWYTVAICLLICVLGGVAAGQWWSIEYGYYDPARDDGESAAEVSAHIARLKMFSAATLPAFALLCFLVIRLSRRNRRLNRPPGSQPICQAGTEG